MKLSGRLASALGEAFGDLGGTEASPKIAGLAAIVEDLAEAQPPERKKSKRRKRGIPRESSVREPG